MSIRKRKKEHVDLSLKGDHSYDKTAGFERYEFIHNALPEVNLDEVSTKATLLGREFDFPLFISSMTGGYSKGGAINRRIAEFCQKHNLPFGVGSQRVMLENPSVRESFRIVRDAAPDAFIASNIGGNQLRGGLPAEDVDLIVNTIQADAVIIHLNPLQELVQKEGDRSFEGIEEGIRKLIGDTDLPVIVKETGAGFSTDSSKRLLELGVRVIDISGAGGTSWSKIENRRLKAGADNTPEFDYFKPFENWGIPTAASIRYVEQNRENFTFEMIASGGIRSPFDMAKAIALGADFTATAQPVISALDTGTNKTLEALYNSWQIQFRMILTLLGCRTPRQLGPKLLRIV